MVSIRRVSILGRLRRRDDDEQTDTTDAATASAADLAKQRPDPFRPPVRRGTWDQAALLNTTITETVKRQLGTVTPPWKK